MKKGSSSALAIVAIVIVAVATSGCATSERPLPITKRVALTPPKDDVAVLARAGQPIGEVIPVDLSIANGTDEPYMVDPGQVFAIDDQGQKILTVPSAEAIQEAGDANSLKAALTGAGKSAAVGAVAGAAIGAALGVAVGAILGSPASGAAFGAAMGGGYGAGMGGLTGGMQAQAAARGDAATQINALCLQPGPANPNYSINGYVFFPKGIYQGIQINLLDQETHQTRTVTAAWSEAGASATSQSVSPPSTAVRSSRVVPVPEQTSSSHRLTAETSQTTE